MLSQHIDDYSIQCIAALGISLPLLCVLDMQFVISHCPT